MRTFENLGTFPLTTKGERLRKKNHRLISLSRDDDDLRIKTTKASLRALTTKHNSLWRTLSSPHLCYYFLLSSFRWFHRALGASSSGDDDPSLFLCPFKVLLKRGRKLLSYLNLVRSNSSRKRQTTESSSTTKRVLFKRVVWTLEKSSSLWTLSLSMRSLGQRMREDVMCG